MMDAARVDPTDLRTHAANFVVQRRFRVGKNWRKIGAKEDSPPQAAVKIEGMPAGASVSGSAHLGIGT
jgi:hypothetical protein